MYGMTRVGMPAPAMVGRSLRWDTVLVEPLVEVEEMKDAASVVAVVAASVAAVVLASVVDSAVVSAVVAVVCVAVDRSGRSVN